MDKEIRVRERVEKYGLSSQNGVKYMQAETQLKNQGFVVSKKGMNCLFSSSGKESTKHFVSKAIIFKILRDRGRTVVTEVETTIQGPGSWDQGILSSE